MLAVPFQRRSPQAVVLPPFAWAAIALGAVVVLSLFCTGIYLNRRRRQAKIPTFTLAASRLTNPGYHKSNLTFAPRPKSMRFNKVAPWPEPPDFPLQDYPDTKAPSFADTSPPQPFKPVLILTPPSPAYRRQSRQSFTSLFSVTSTRHGYSPCQKIIRRSFDPLLPDELLVTIGESVMIIHSYTDGWCVVGRDGLDGEMEVGAVPAWCFLKSRAGITWERQTRVESLGARQQMKA